MVARVLTLLLAVSFSAAAPAKTCDGLLAPAVAALRAANSPPQAATAGSPARLLIISAPSGAGKTTLIDMLNKKYPGRFFVSVSATTRPPRPGEVDGRDYIFTNRDDFPKQIAAGAYVEWAEVHGNYYGTPQAPLEAALQSGKTVILNIDVQGAEIVRKAFPGQSVRTIFIMPPSLTELRRRLVDRGTETAESLERRLADADAEMQSAKQYDSTIVNDDLAAAFAQLEKAVL